MKFSVFLAGAAFWAVLALFWRFSVSAFFWRISAFGAVNFFLDLGLLGRHSVLRWTRLNLSKRENGFSGFFTFLEALGLGILLEDLSLLGGHFGL